MGLFSSLIDALSSNGDKVSSDPKTTSVTERDGNITVRNSDVIVNHSEGNHDTVWSNTTVNVNTGQTSSNEGAHGPNFKS